MLAAAAGILLSRALTPAFARLTDENAITVPSLSLLSLMNSGAPAPQPHGRAPGARD